MRVPHPGTPPEAMFLIAPYISIAHLITSYRLGGVVQIFAPIKLIPNHQSTSESQAPASSLLTLLAQT
jgi:hypothetical protein